MECAAAAVAVAVYHLTKALDPPVSSIPMMVGAVTSDICGCPDYAETCELGKYMEERICAYAQSVQKNRSMPRVRL